MTAEQDPSEEKKRPIRFDFPAGASADMIAKALNEARDRIRAEREAKKQASTQKPPSD
jgi:hypothetical protein